MKGKKEYEDDDEEGIQDQEENERERRKQWKRRMIGLGRVEEVDKV